MYRSESPTKSARSLLLLPLCGWLLLSMVGCRQNEGERCQVDSDCAETLYCELAGKDPALGGICKNRASGTVDASVPAQDLTSGADLTPPGDAAVTDGAVVDGGG